MCSSSMTPERALIILDRLNTDERIEVDRAELKEAVAVAKAAIQKTIPRRCARDPKYNYQKLCCRCGKEMWIKANYCSLCGQALMVKQ